MKFSIKLMLLDATSTL